MSGRRVTRADVQSHNNKQDAFIIIDNLVYNVTEFLEDHPGGAEILLDNAGKDASECFHDIGHSADAKQWMTKFLVAEIVEEDKWEVRRRETSWSGSQSGDGGSLQSLVAAWLPPLALSVLAVLFYLYLFG